MISDLKPYVFKPQKPLVVTWNTWRKGWNTLLRENEIDPQELVATTNAILVGSGLPTKRWGSQVNFQGGATGTTNFVLPIKDANDNIQVLSLTDWGYLTKQSGASYTQITGASFPSGYDTEGVLLGGKVYLVNPNTPLVRYNFTNLNVFNTLATPTSVTASVMSTASGGYSWSWRVSATSPVGETIASTAISLSTLPQDLSKTVVRVGWSAVSAASGDLVGYNIYRGAPGGEVWVGGVDALATSFWDYGTYANDPTKTAPIVDTTKGPKAKYIIRFQDRMILAGIDGAPTKVLISGHYPNHERFDWYSGGGSILVEPDSGDNITGLGVYYKTSNSTQTIVIFKERSVWEMSLSVETYGSYGILVPSYRMLTASQGCSSNRSIVAVENDLMFANTRGLYILRYEPQLINVINANEISAKIRPFFQNLTNADISNSAAVYADKKYIISFPISKQHICFDRERLAFTGPWITPFGVAKWGTYIDASGVEHAIAASSSDSNIYEFVKSLTSDSGTSINVGIKTRKEDFGDWTMYKTLNEIYANFARVFGTIQVNIYIEDRSGSVVTAKSYTINGSSISGTAGLGIDEMGLQQLGLSSGLPTSATGETPTKVLLYKTVRTMQMEIMATGVTDNFELWGIKAIGLPQARGNNPTTWNL